MCLAQGPQRSDAGEARTRGPSVSSQALYHWATALPKYFFSLMRVRVLVRPFFTFNTSVCVCVCVRACGRACVCTCVCVRVRACSFQLFFYCIFASWYIFHFIIKFQIQLISYALCFAGSVSVRAAVGARRKINHHWLMIFLSFN